MRLAAHRGVDLSYCSGEIKPITSEVDQSILLINPSVSETAIITAALSRLQGVKCVAFREEPQALEWAKAEANTVSAVVLPSSSLVLLRSLKGLPATRHSLFYGIDRSPAWEWPTGDSLVESLLVTPFPPPYFEEKVESLVKLRGQRKLAALFIDETGKSQELICRSLAETGFLTVFQAEDTVSAWDMLQERKQQISLVVACWEMPSRQSLDLLFRTRQDPNLGRVPFLLVTSPESLDQMKQAKDRHTLFTECWTGPWFDERGLDSHVKVFAVALERQKKVDSFLREALVFLSRGVPRHATGILSHAVKMFPDSEVLFDALGDMHSASFEDPAYLESAALAFDRCLSLSKANRDVAMKCAAIFARLDRFDEVARVLRSFLQVSPLDEEVRTYLARVFLQRGDHGAAAVELRRVLCLNPTNAKAAALLQMAESLKKRNQPPKAA